MVSEVNAARTFLINKFGAGNTVPAGSHAIPYPTSKGDAFMKVVISDRGDMSDFHLFWDEELKISWYDFNKDGSKNEKA